MAGCSEQAACQTRRRTRVNKVKCPCICAFRSGNNALSGALVRWQRAQPRRHAAAHWGGGSASSPARRSPQLPLAAPRRAEPALHTQIRLTPAPFILPRPPCPGRDTAGPRRVRSEPRRHPTVFRPSVINSGGGRLNCEPINHGSAACVGK